MNSNEIAHFENLFNQLIVKEKRRARAQLRDLLRDANRGDDVDLSILDREQALELRLEGRQNKYLLEIERALEKIHEGEFGNCEECGCDIDIKRLMARPTASKCVVCKEEEEKLENQVFYLRRAKVASKTRSKSVGNISA